MNRLSSVRGVLLANPFRLLPLAFGAMVGLGTLLLMAPIATASGRDTSFLHALFTATSAVCVTGLAVVDTATHWTGFGQGVILLLVQLGGLGIVTVVSVALLLVSDNPMSPEGVKTAASDRDVSRRYVQAQLEIGIDALRELRDSGTSIKHMRFEELP